MNVLIKSNRTPLLLVKNGEEDCHKIIKHLFHVFRFGLDFCTANRCWENNGLQALLSLFVKRSPVVWTFNFGHNTDVWDSGGSEYIEKDHALLVRSL